MQERTNDALVLKDERGNLYAIPLGLLEQLRVPEDRRAEVEAAIGDVSGHALHLAGAGALVLAGLWAAGEAYLNYETKWYATR